MLTKQTFLQQCNKIKKSYETGTLSTVSTLKDIEYLIYKAYNYKLIDKNFNEEGIMEFYYDMKKKGIKQKIDDIKSFLQELGFLQNKKHNYSLKYIKILCKQLSKEYGKAKEFYSFCYHYNLK